MNLIGFTYGEAINPDSWRLALGAPRTCGGLATGWGSRNNYDLLEDALRTPRWWSSGRRIRKLPASGVYRGFGKHPAALLAQGGWAKRWSSSIRI